MMLEVMFGFVVGVWLVIGVTAALCPPVNLFMWGWAAGTTTVALLAIILVHMLDA